MSQVDSTTRPLCPWPLSLTMLFFLEACNFQSPVEETSNHVANVSTESREQAGRELYKRHCVACHGDRGDGKGLAARFLYPKPRDFRAGKFRLVSTANGVPTREDLSAVLVRGMNGSSMTPWLHLTVEEREALIDEVLQLHRDGMREQYVLMLKQVKDLTEEEISQEDVQEEIRTFVERRTTPGPSHKVPEIGQPDANAIAAWRSGSPP